MQKSPQKLPPTALEELRTLWEQESCGRLTDAELEDMAHRLLVLFDLIYREPVGES